jgi:hypothetical protein
LELKKLYCSRKSDPRVKTYLLSASWREIFNRAKVETGGGIKSKTLGMDSIFKSRCSLMPGLFNLFLHYLPKGKWLRRSKYLDTGPLASAEGASIERERLVHEIHPSGFPEWCRKDK